MTSSVSVTPDGRIELAAKRVRILGVDGLALMRALGLSLASMMDLSKAHGVTVRPQLAHHRPAGNSATAGHPRHAQRRSHLRRPARADSGRLHRHDAPRQTIDPSAKNYMLYRGGTLHFTKLYMPDAEMLVADEDQSTPFDFDNAH